MSDDFDPAVAYCVKGCGEPVVGEQFVSVTADAFGDVNDFTPIAQLVCRDHLEAP